MPRTKGSWATLIPLLFLFGALAVLVVRLGRAPDETPEAPAPRRPPAWFEADLAVLLDREYVRAAEAAIDGARRSIDVLQYQWAWEETEGAAPRRLLDALVRAAGRGVRVRVLLEERAADESDLTFGHRRVIEHLRARGVDARLDDPARELHDKVIVIDGETAIVASHSHSTAALLFNHEAAAIVVPREAGAMGPLQAYIDEAMGEGRDIGFPLGPPPPSAAPAGPWRTPPLVRGRARWAIAGDYEPFARALVRRARTRIAIGMYYLKPTALVPGHPVDDLLLDLRRAAERGVLVEVVLDEEVQGAGLGANDAARDLLRKIGARVRYDDPATISHAKVVVVDGRYALLGSHNWSRSAFRENRETSVLLDEPSLGSLLAAYVAETFPAPGPGAPPPPLAEGEKVDLNTATRRDLMRLPGIGEALADRILEHRAALGGRFRSVHDLEDVPGIGPDRYRAIAPHVVAGP